MAIKDSPVKTWLHGEVSYAKALHLAKVRQADVVARFGTWVVTKYGLECLATHYAIEKGRLWENESYPWPRHMAKKVWTNMEDFLAAFEYAQDYYRTRGKA